MTKKELQSVVLEKYEKYNALLWYARTDGKPIMQINDKGKLADIVAEKIKEYQEKYPQETQALAGEHSDWQHGFHSGCNAAFSYVLTCLDKLYGVDALEQAEMEFPYLDS